MRRLNPDESAAWGRVMATVRPMRAAAQAVAPGRPAPVVRTPPPEPPPLRPAGRVPPARPPAPRTGIASVQALAMRREPVNTLDGSWDKKLGRGAVIPDSSIDLHGHTLASAHALLDQGLDRAIRRGDRVLLLVTGKPPRPESERPHARGAIRAAVADWLGSSRHADAIAAVRSAHPRHGGHGALYIVLRRPRER